MKQNYFKPARLFLTAAIGLTSFGVVGQFQTLECVRANVQYGYSNVLSEIPDYYAFSYDGGDFDINDGGGDMYDGGNMMNTNFATNILYTSGTIIQNGDFGTGSEYFTMQLPGLFIMATDMNAVTEFSITGNNGADGSGLYSVHDFQITYGGQDYLVFTKRVYDAGDPSINHMMIIPLTGGVVHTYATNTDDDFDQIANISGVTRMYYLLFAKQNGGLVTDLEMENAANSFLDLINGSSLFITNNPTGAICPGESVSADYDFCDFTPLAGNVFSLELSDETGSFTTPTVLASNASLTAGTLNGNLPTSIISSSDYRLRVTASNPASIGFASQKFKIRATPATYNEEACIGDTLELYEDGNPMLVWYADGSTTTPLIIAESYTLENVTTNTSLFVSYAGQSFEQFLGLDTTNVAVVEHESGSGDDRGGIAITPEYLYVVGDNNTVRMDAESLTNHVSLPIRDGIFSDLLSGQLFDFYDNVLETNIYDEYFPFNFNSLMKMDQDLNYTGEEVVLSETIVINASWGNGVFAGSGFMIYYDYNTGLWYHIDVTSGTVTEVGQGYSPNLYGSENWSDWGFATINEGDTLVYYRDGTNIDIVSLNLNTGDVVIAQSFNDISDMSSITYSPWKSRMYFHHEYESELTDFVEYYETAGYINGSHSGSYVTIPGECRSEVSVTVTDCTSGIDENELALVSLYPNPATHSIFVDLSQLNGQYSVSVFDLSGRNVYSMTGAKDKAEISVARLQAGYYVVKIQNEQEDYSIPFIKQ